MSIRTGRPTSSPTLVPLGQDRREEMLELDQWAFAFAETQADSDAALTGFEWDRTVAAELDGTLAGVHSVYSLRLPVPGGEVPVAGLTWVAVHPQHRRRGVLTAMMRHHLTSVHEGGEAVSALWAAEPAIYGRFGYGLATLGMRLRLARGVGLHDVPGSEDLHVTFAHAEAERHTEVVHRVFDRVREHRPGMVSRPGDLAARQLADPPVWREGSETLRLLLVSDAAGDPRGYALFRRKEKWEDAGPRGEVMVREAHAVDAAAARALWGRLSDLDLMATLRTDSRPLDDPLLHLLADPRAATPTVSDGLWVRLVDVAEALAGRRYTREVDVVLAVEDPLCPWNTGRFRLAGGPDGASCEPTPDPADLAVDVRALGSAYLGGQTLAGLHGAGRVTELRPGALAAASAALAWPVTPYCGWTF